jgi:hypothetical protein
MKKKITGLALALGHAWSCSGGPSTDLDRVPVGVWGGAHLELTVTDLGGTSEFDCAHGTLDSALAVDGEGRFDVPGTLVREGGPEHEGTPRPRQIVRYAGKMDGRAIELDVFSATGEPIGSFRVEHGRPATLWKCL